MRIAQNEMYHR